MLCFFSIETCVNLAFLSNLIKLDNFKLSNKPIVQCRVANQIKKQIAAGKFAEATDTWNELEDLITKYSNNVVWIWRIYV